MKKIERLRQEKTQAVDRMNALLKLAADEKRDNTQVELDEYATKKALAESLSAEITLLERAEAHPVPAAPEPKVEQLDAATLKAQGAKEERERRASIQERLDAAKLNGEVAAKILDAPTIEAATSLIFEALSKPPAAASALVRDARVHRRDRRTGRERQDGARALAVP